MAMYDYVYEKDFRELSDWVKKTIPYSVKYGKVDVEKNLEDIVEKEGPFEEDTTLWCKDGEDMHVPSMYTFLTSLAYIYSYVRSYVSENFSNIGHKHEISDVNELNPKIDELNNGFKGLRSLFADLEDEVDDTINKVNDIKNEINDIKNKISYMQGQHIKINNYQRYYTDADTGKKYLCTLYVYYRARDGKYHSDSYGEGAITMDIRRTGAQMSVRAQWGACISTTSSTTDPNIKIYTPAGYTLPTAYNFSSESISKSVKKNDGSSVTMQHRSLKYYYDVNTDTALQDIYIVDLNTSDSVEKLELVCEVTKQEVSTASKAASTKSADSIEDIGEEKVVGIFTGNVDLSQYI